MSSRHLHSPSRRAALRDVFHGALRGTGQLVLLLGAPQLAWGAAILAVRVWPARDYTRVTIESDQPLSAAHQLVQGPDRLVVDIDGLELSATLSRDTTNKLSAQAAQVKWRITPAQENGCNMAAVLGVARARGDGNTPYLSGNLSCTGVGPASIHINLGAQKPKDVKSVGTWGVAAEFPMASWTPHVEWFGAQQSKPTFQIGARTQLTPALQLDGTVGCSDGQSVATVGLKFQF